MKETAAADTVVATRYHNLVCALKTGTPTLALSYAAKSDALMDRMGLAAFCHPARDVDATGCSRSSVNWSGGRRSCGRPSPSGTAPLNGNSRTSSRS